MAGVGRAEQFAQHHAVKRARLTYDTRTHEWVQVRTDKGRPVRACERGKPVLPFVIDSRTHKEDLMRAKAGTYGEHASTLAKAEMDRRIAGARMGAALDDERAWQNHLLAYKEAGGNARPLPSRPYAGVLPERTSTRKPKREYIVIDL